MTGKGVYSEKSRGDFDYDQSAWKDPQVRTVAPGILANEGYTMIQEVDPLHLRTAIATRYFDLVATRETALTQNNDPRTALVFEKITSHYAPLSEAVVARDVFQIRLLVGEQVFNLVFDLDTPEGPSLHSVLEEPDDAKDEEESPEDDALEDQTQWWIRLPQDIEND